MKHGSIDTLPECIPTIPFNNYKCLCALAVRLVAATSVGPISDRSRPVRSNDIGSLVFPNPAKYCH